jgi:uncharacterized protein
MDLGTSQFALLCLLIVVVALLYSSVGHAGASGYLAAMALFGIAPAIMKPSALILNILVASIGTFQFARVHAVRWKLLAPFAAGSIPMAFLGGTISLSSTTYRTILGVLLIYGAWRLAARIPASEEVSPMRHWSLGVALGAGVGFLAGLVGIGGGIFLSPLLLLRRWSTARETAGISVAFILVNSIAGLLGHISTVKTIPSIVPLLAACAMGGGIVGSTLGARYLSFKSLRYLLAIVLAVAGVKLVLP